MTAEFEDCYGSFQECYKNKCTCSCHKKTSNLCQNCGHKEKTHKGVTKPYCYKILKDHSQCPCKKFIPAQSQKKAYPLSVPPTKTSDLPLSEKQVKIDWGLFYEHENVASALNGALEDIESSVQNIKDVFLKTDPESQFQIGKIQGLRIAEDKIEKRFGEFR